MKKLIFVIILGLNFSANAMIAKIVKTLKININKIIAPKSVNEYDSIFSFFDIPKEFVEMFKDLPIELQALIAQQKSLDTWWYQAATFTADDIAWSPSESQTAVLTPSAIFNNGQLDIQDNSEIAASNDNPAGTDELLEDSQDSKIEDTDTTKRLAVKSKLFDKLNHDGTIESLIVNENADRALTLSKDATISLWDLEGNLITTFEQRLIHEALFFNPEGDRIVTISGNSTAKLWDHFGNLIANFPHDAQIYSLVYNEKHDQVLTASYDNEAKLWKLYKNPTVEQILLKKLISLYLTSKKPSKAITEIENLLSSISFDFELNYYELAEIWKSLPEDVSKAFWSSIENFIWKFGK